MIERAEQVILVADHSKFEQRAFENVCDLDCLDYLVTDASPSLSFARTLSEKRVAVKVGAR